MSDDGLPAARARVREAFGVHGWNPSPLLIEAVARAAREDFPEIVIDRQLGAHTQHHDRRDT